MATGNPYFTAVEENSPGQVPLPMEMLLTAGQAIQGRADAAYEAMESSQQGLSSMEAYAPAHIEYRDQLANSFRERSSDLLDEFDGRASDPQFQRRMRSLINEYSSDPNLSIISQANQAYKDKMKSIQKISESGGRYIDTNPRFTGADETGRLISDVGSVKKTTWEEDLQKELNEIAKAKIGDGSVTTNQQALEYARDSYLQNLGGDPTTREALQYFLGQGYSPEEAINQVQNTLTRMTGSRLDSRKDDMNERLSISYSNLAMRGQELAMRAEKHEWDREDRELAMDNSILPSFDPIVTNKLNEGLVSQINDALKAFDSSGNLSQRVFEVPYNPENARRYPNGRVRSSSAGTGAAGQSFIEISSEDFLKDSQDIITKARDVVQGESQLTDKQVLDTYKYLLDQEGYTTTFFNTTDPKVRKNLTEIYGSDLRDAYYRDHKGNEKKFENSNLKISDLKNMVYTGHTDAPRDFDGTPFSLGSVRLIAEDADGKNITIYKPLNFHDKLYQLNMTRNTSARALGSGLSNDQLLGNSEYAITIPTGEGGSATAYPQVKEINGSLKVMYHEVDNRGNIIAAYDPSSVEQHELTQTSRYLNTLK